MSDEELCEKHFCIFQKQVRKFSSGATALHSFSDEDEDLPASTLLRLKRRGSCVFRVLGRWTGVLLVLGGDGHEELVLL